MLIYNVIDYGVTADVEQLQTIIIQRVLDMAGDNDGVVLFPSGVYHTGGLHIHGALTIQLDKGAVLQGSDNCLDYGTGAWTEAFITGENLSSFRIIGEGTIDGVDCFNPQGEENFRGPHGILLANCRQIEICGITIVRSSNWAIYCHDCVGATLDNVTILGGHDGLHTQRCTDFVVKNCDFRTGDDAYAGSDNENFEITNCQINASCNGLHLGCMNITLQNCRFWAPGEYIHRVSGRTNMFAAICHLSPVDRNPVKLSGNWLVKDCTAENCDSLYEYNYLDGLWQTGQPVTTIKFENVIATGLKIPSIAIGDDAHQLQLTMENVTLELRDGVEKREFLNARKFGTIALHNVKLKNAGDGPLIVCDDGDSIIIDNVKSDNKNPYLFSNVSSVED
jgi:hypothetical protein